MYKIKYYRVIYQIRKIINITDVNTAIMLYYTNFFCVMNYNLYIRGSSPYSVRISRFQKKIISILARVANREHYRIFFVDLYVLTISSLCIYSCLVCVWKNVSLLRSRYYLRLYSIRSADNWM